MEIKLTLTPEQVEFLRKVYDPREELLDDRPLTAEEASEAVEEIIDGAMTWR